MNPPIRVGVSPCLLGKNVRYAGDHARDRFVSDVIADAFEWVETCPEVGIGLGVPRPTIQLERFPNGLRLTMPCTGTDLTDRMKEYCRTRAKALVLQGLAGYIFKSRSPSCGTREVKVYSRRGGFRRVGRGFFAAEIMGRFPLLPVITEEELHDPLRRLGWITRVFAMAPLGDLWRRRWTRDALAAFHESYALTLRAHSPAAERRLRALSANAASRRELRAAYEAGFHKTLAQPTSRGKQARILRGVRSI